MLDISPTSSNHIELSISEAQCVSLRMSQTRDVGQLLHEQ